MNSSMPQQQNLRSFDTKQMSSTPKWPIVLIVLLLLVIVVAVALIIFRPWEAPSPQGPSDGGTQVSVSSAADQGGTTGTDQAADATGETAEPAGRRAHRAACRPRRDRRAFRRRRLRAADGVV